MLIKEIYFVLKNFEDCSLKICKILFSALPSDYRLNSGIPDKVNNGINKLYNIEIN